MAHIMYHAVKSMPIDIVYTLPMGASHDFMFLPYAIHRTVTAVPIKTCQKLWKNGITHPSQVLKENYPHISMLQQILTKQEIKQVKQAMVVHLPSTSPFETIMHIQKTYKVFDPHPKESYHILIYVNTPK